MGGVLIALAASAVWGTSDFLGGLLSRGRTALAVMAVSQTAGLVLLSGLLLVVADGFPGAAIVPPAILAGAGVGLGVMCLYQALSIGPMSVVAPLTSLSAAVPVAVGIASGDRPSWLQGAGMLAAVVGCFVAARTPGEGTAPRRSGIVFAALAAALLGTGMVGLDRAADHDVLWGLELSRACAVVLVVTLAVAVRRRALGRELRPVAPAALVGVLDLSASGLFAYASTLGLLSVVSVLGSVYPVVTVLLARVVLGERMSRLQAGGVVLAFAGVGLLAGG